MKKNIRFKGDFCDSKSYFVILRTICILGIVFYGFNFFYIKALQLGEHVEIILLNANIVFICGIVIVMLFSLILISLVNHIIAKKIGSMIEAGLEDYV